MALSLESIYRPFNEFFSQKFAAADAPVTFRFAGLPQALYDGDFMNPLDPAMGQLAAIAQERGTSLVDGVPLLDADGRNVTMCSPRISDLYHDEIVGPAIAYVPDGITNDADRQARMDAFVAAKADAIRQWDKVKSLSVIEGDGVYIRPSPAMPTTWWDRNDASVWIRQSFQVHGAATTPGVPAPPPDHLLRLKIDNVVLQNVLQTHLVARQPVDLPPAPPRANVMLSHAALAAARPIFSASLANDATRAKTVRPIARMPTALAAQTLNAVSIHDNLISSMTLLPFAQRQEIQLMLAKDAPTQPVITSDATISFDYCVVNVTRPWLHAAFLNNAFWQIPGQGKGQLSANDGHGLAALPVGFVAIKSLSIQAPWTPDDISNLELSTQFGPFNFDSKVVDGTIRHDGIQIIGWMLQELPDLPPNAA